jgi:hypothetical protein
MLTMKPYALRSYLEKSFDLRHGFTHPVTRTAAFVALVSLIAWLTCLLFPEIYDFRLIPGFVMCFALLISIVFQVGDFVLLTGTHRSMIVIDKGGYMQVQPLSSWCLRWDTLVQNDAVVFCFTPHQPIKFVITSECRDQWGNLARKTRLTVFFKIVPDPSTNMLDDHSIRSILQWFSNGFAESAGAHWKHVDDVTFLKELARECVVTGKELEILVPRPQATITATNK